MNREIKFRAWDKTFNKMIKVTDLNLDNRSLIGYAGERLVSCRFDDCELLQYTGLKDKNGVEIYEGDIVERDSRYKKAEIGSVQYDNNYASFLGRDTLLWLTSSMGGQEFDGQVIGNIYENLELLEETK